MDDLQRQFIRAFETNCEAFGIALSTEKIFRLAKYYELIQTHNPILHLVAPSDVETFVIRHILESIYAEQFMPKNAAFADLGTGAGLPAVPLLIARKDLRGTLVESKLKKANFLEEVLTECRLENQAKILNRQFEELEKPNVAYVLCRAIDKFIEKLPKILRWAKGSRLVFFGGPKLGENLEKHGVKFERQLVPQSEQRFVFAAKN